MAHYLKRPLPPKPCPGWALVCGPAYAHLSAHCDRVRNATRETEGRKKKWRFVENLSGIKELSLSVSPIPPFLLTVANSTPVRQGASDQSPN